MVGIKISLGEFGTGWQDPLTKENWVVVYMQSSILGSSESGVQIVG